MNWETLLVMTGLGIAALMVLRVAGNAVEWAVRVADAQDELVRVQAKVVPVQAAPDDDVPTAELMPQPPTLLAAGDMQTNGSLPSVQAAGDDPTTRRRA